MKWLIKKETIERIECTVQSNRVLRCIFSHVFLSLFYGMLLLLYEVKFSRELVPALHPFFIVWALVLVTYDLLIRRYWEKIPFYKLLLFFAVSAGVSVVLNINAGIVGNIKSWIMTMLPLAVFYPVCLLEEESNRKKALLKSFSGVAVLMFLASVAALVLYMLRVNETITFLGIEHHVGWRYYHESVPTSGVLLYGLYTDTNHTAIYSLLFILYSIVLFAESKKGLFKKTWQNKLCKIFAVCNMIVQALYFPLANSRGGWLALGVLCATIIFLLGLNKRTFFKSAFRCYFASAVAACLSVVLVLGALFLVRTGVSELSLITSKAIASLEESLDPSAPADPINPNDPVTPGEPIVQNPPKTDVTEHDSFDKQTTTSGAGRIPIWKEAIRLFIRKPVFGECPGNNAYYARQYQFDEMLAYGKAIHNSFLDLLVDYGAVGFLLLMSFFLISAWKFLQVIVQKNAKTDWSYIVFFGMIMLIAIAAVFLSCLFISTTEMYYLLLIPFGYCVSYLPVKKKE